MPEQGEELPTNEKVFVSPPDVTKVDIEALEIKLDNLPNGTLNHQYKAKLSTLYLRLEHLNKIGWTQSDKDNYNNIFQDVRDYIHFLEMDKFRTGNKN